MALALLTLAASARPATLDDADASTDLLSDFRHLGLGHRHRADRRRSRAPVPGVGDHRARRRRRARSGHAHRRGRSDLGGRVRVRADVGTAATGLRAPAQGPLAESDRCPEQPGPTRGRLSRLAGSFPAALLFAGIAVGWSRDPALALAISYGIPILLLPLALPLMQRSGRADQPATTPSEAASCHGVVFPPARQRTELLPE